MYLRYNYEYFLWPLGRGEENKVTDGLARYRVDVVATTVADVVRCAGGWIFDSVMQGWAVNVLVTQPGDARALAILGATVNESHADCPAPQVTLAEDDTLSDSDVVEHRLSAAARRFKTHALAALDLPAEVALHESFWVTGRHKDLIAGRAPEVFDTPIVTAVRLP